MTVDASIPKALYQANIDLALRIAALLQENGKQWFDLFAEEAGTRLDEGLSGFGGGFSLEKLASLPADATTQFLQIDVGRWQALLSHAVDNQSHFADGLQGALKDWQASCAEAFDAAATGVLPKLGSFSVLPGLSDVAASFQRFVAQAIPAANAPRHARPAAPEPAPRPAAAKPAKKPAAKKAAVRPATPKPKAAPAPDKAAPARAARPARKAAVKAPVKLAPVLAPTPLPAVVTTPRKSKKPATPGSD